MERERRFAALLSRVARGITRLEREVCCSDLTLQQFDALRLLRGGEATVSAVAAALGIDVSTASRNLALLARRGYVKRRRGREDSRQVFFALAKKGTDCLDSLCCDERLVFAGLLARIPASERASVAHALDVLDAALAGGCDAPACEPGTCKARIGGS